MASASSQPPPEAKSLATFSDGISALSYLPKNSNDTKQLLACSSWDGTVQIHDTASQTDVVTQTMDSGPLLSLAVAPGSAGTNSILVTGGMDGSVKVFDYTTNTTRLVGRHESSSSDGSSVTSSACSCLVALSSNLVASASWNRQLCLWDVRAPSGKPVSTLELPGKAFAMDVDPSQSTRLVVATSGRRNCVIDVKDGKLESVLDRESSLKFQTRCVQFFPDGRGFALGSVEGRVGVEFLDELGVPNNNMKRFAFKCHRANDTVYPVNCIAFHPRFTSAFATGGCDGSVVLWDGVNKKKLTAFPSFPTSISAIAFNHDGSEMAVASSYTFEDGDREHPQDELFIRPLLDSECTPKPK